MTIRHAQPTDITNLGPRATAGFSDPDVTGIGGAVECDRCGAYVARARQALHSEFHEHSREDAVGSFDRHDIAPPDAALDAAPGAVAAAGPTGSGRLDPDGTYDRHDVG